MDTDNAAVARLTRFAELARALEGRDEGFGSELCASRELEIVRERFLAELDAGAPTYEAFCIAIDQVRSECTAQGTSQP